MPGVMRKIANGKAVRRQACWAQSVTSGKGQELAREVTARSHSSALPRRSMFLSDRFAPGSGLILAMCLSRETELLEMM